MSFFNCQVYLSNSPRLNLNPVIENQHVPLFVANSNVCLIRHRLRDINSRNVNDLELYHLEWTKVKCKYANRKATCDFLCWQ